MGYLLSCTFRRLHTILVHMKTRTRDLVILVAGLAVLATVAFGGYAAVRARAEGSGASQALAPVPKVSPAPSSAAEPQYDRWTVGKAVGPLVAYAKPSTSSRVKTQLGKVNQNGYPTLVLVDQTKEVGGRVWYRVWLAVRPNGSRGWVPEGKLAFYTTPAKITIDLSSTSRSASSASSVEGSSSTPTRSRSAGPGWRRPRASSSSTRSSSRRLRTAPSASSRSASAPSR